jgi:peptidoglycan/LPS O-acetylase OafA/YrhL
MSSLVTAADVVSRSSQPDAKTEGRIPVLDGLRAISILLVLSGHMLPLGPKFLSLNETAASMGMSLFFGLSGFLIASVLIRNPDVPEFVIKRLSRIVPLAYAYAFIVYTFIHFDPAQMLWTASFIENYFPAHLDNFNAHFWSLCVEVQFYMAIAFVVFCCGSKGIWIVWPACLAITALRVNNGAYVHIQTHLRVDEILIGSCLATLYHQAWWRPIKYAGALVPLAVLFWFISSSPFSHWVQYLRPYATVSVMGLVLCLGDLALARLLSSRPLRYVATVSYALYVVHPLTVQGWWNTGTVFERYLFKRPISFAMTFLAAHVSTFYWERRWLQAGRLWIKHRRLQRGPTRAVPKTPG